MQRVQPVVEDHVRLTELLDRIQGLAAAPAATLPPARWHRLWEAELSELSALLQQHFAREEEGGYLAEVVARRPSWSDRIARLGREHTGLAAGLHQIVGQLGQTHPPPGLGEWSKAMRAHERAESEILQSAWYTDRGTGD